MVGNLIMQKASNYFHVAKVRMKNLSFYTGIALLGANSDMNEERSLTYENGITDIYSNSWGPSDNGYIVDGPGRLTKLAFQNGVRQVSIVTTASCSSMFPKLSMKHTLCILLGS